MDKKSKRLEGLKKKQEQLKAQIQTMEATEKSRERKRETRRKILIGAYYIDKAKEKDSFDNIVKLMDGYLNRDSDRVLFNLEPIENKKSK